MAGGCEERRRFGLFDDLPEIHDADAVGHQTNDRKVVRDEQAGQAEFPLKLLQKVEDLPLNRDVESARRLVQNQEIRLAGERAGD